MTKLKKSLEEYLSVRRVLGFKLHQDGNLLHVFVEFVEKKKVSFVTIKLALEWATQPKDVQPAWWAKRLGMVRGFAKYLSATDPRTEIPTRELLPYRYHRKTPHIYTDTEISKLISIAKKLKSPRGLRATTISTIIGLLAATGMRISESINLNNKDVDLKSGILTVRGTKFNKSRLVPVHISTRDKLRKYARLRDKIYPRPQSPSFFISERGTRFGDHTLRCEFVSLLHQIGLRNHGDSDGPRLHDLRHKFAVKTMLGWYHSGVNVERNIVALTTYLGHRSVNDTYWYISGIPELLQLAALRLEKEGELT
jgi:integrase/recombinase XerD